MLPRTLGRDRRALTLRATLAVALSLVLVGAALPAAADQTAVTDTSLDAAASLPVETMTTDAAVADAAIADTSMSDTAIAGAEVADVGVVDSAVQPAYLTGFNPSNLISDALFYDGGAMTSAEIQRFLEQRVSSCSNDRCIRDLRASITSRSTLHSQATGNLVCNAIQGGTNLRISEIIYRVQKACGISAKVILTTLQKEQGVVTSSAPSAWNIQQAMGAYCPDTSPCDPRFSGIGAQIVTGTIQLKMYKAGRFAKQPGTHFIGWHPNSACGGKTITVSNYATAALYSYTPYQPNAAALRAGWGIGDSCSSYGNRNFYNYYTSWFGSTQASSPCATPIGTGNASWTYQLREDLRGRAAPNTSCASGTDVSAGVIMKAVATTADGKWRKLQTEYGQLWFPLADLRHVTVEEASCAVPEASGSATWTYTTTVKTTGRAVASSACSNGAIVLAEGTVATATRTSLDGSWRKLHTGSGELWVPRDDIREASAAESACAFPSDAGSASWTYVVENDVEGLSAPDVACGIDPVPITSGTIAKAIATTADGQWRQLDTVHGRVWLPMADLSHASIAEAACATPTGTRPASWTYTLIGNATGRVGPDDACTSSEAQLEQGSTAVAVATTADEQWRLLRTEHGDRWVPITALRQATSVEASCAQTGPYGPASWTYVTTQKVTGHTTPRITCEDGSVELEEGIAATAIQTSADGEWRQLRAGSGDYWVEVDTLRRASASESACVAPTGVGPASWTYVLTRGVTGRSVPNAACDEGAAPVAAGTVVTATATSSDGLWRKLALTSGDVWVPRDAIRQARSDEDACREPAGVGPASWVYTTLSATDGRLAPDSRCHVGIVDAPEGLTASAIATSRDGEWRKLATPEGAIWVARDQVRQATPDEAECVYPTSTSGASWTYIVLSETAGRTAPSLGCSEGAVPLEIGMIAKAVATTADGHWRKLTTEQGQYWVPMEDLHHVRMSVVEAGDLRMEPADSGTVTSTLSMGTDVIVTASSDSWRRVEAGERVGWVLAANLG
ncbi:SH3 domain-containing protein [Microbacterium sp. LRZ72]|uniref:SH3 domain-containing protein n=1 Tax=Microbacterium sp. LRZ72 TaxID=2942481 RepID=UPI0029B7E0DF|nr:SH3 domain-containing protein [Microbacterium sp. LRZ72]MDX2377014.1 SH3 domain-containing protein [Microbacterium sp. LRZ72]